MKACLGRVVTVQSINIMICDHSTLANVPRLIAQALRDDYDLDPADVLAEAGIDEAVFMRPGARVPFAKMSKLWDLAARTTGDRRFGFRVGAYSSASDFHVLGHSWMASGSLCDALERLCRYLQVISTAANMMSLESGEDTITLVEAPRDIPVPPHWAAVDAGYVALMNLCEAVARRRVIPIGVELIVSPEFSDPEYEQIFGCPVSYGADADRIHFNRVDTEQALPGSVPEVLDASDDIADRYLEALDAASVASQVRRQLIQMLPSGRVDQESVAKKLYRSRATLQRQLGAEGTNFRNILDSTRRNLAERYLREGELSQVEVAYLTGFADQSNFAKAFKRWSGLTPGAYRQEFRQPSDLAQEPQRSA